MSTFSPTEILEEADAEALEHEEHAGFSTAVNLLKPKDLISHKGPVTFHHHPSNSKYGFVCWLNRGMCSF